MKYHTRGHSPEWHIALQELTHYLFAKVLLLIKTKQRQYHAITYALFLEYKVQHYSWRSTGILLMH